MTDIVKISDGTTDIDLYYDSAPGFQLIASGMQFGLPEHDNKMHESEWQDGAMIVRHRLKNREWPVRLAIRAGSDDDDIADTLAAFNRLVVQARRFHTHGDADKVYLEFRPTTSAAWTRYDVIDVEMNQLAMMNYFNRQTTEVIFGKGFAITVHTRPWGYGAKETLQNEVSTPHFEEDGNSDGLADHWTEINNPATTLNTSIYLCGTQSQKVVTDTTGEQGITQNISCSAHQGEDYVAYAWVYFVSGDDDLLAFTVVGDGTVDDVASWTSATTTATGAGGNTWKRLEIESTIGATDTTLTLEIDRDAAGANEATTFYIDKMYLQFDTDAIPDAWMSGRTICNSYDSSTAGEIPYIDVEDVPGDLDAETIIKGEPISDTQQRYYIARWSKTAHAPNCYYWWGTADSATVTTSWTTVESDTSFSVNNDAGKYAVLASVKSGDSVTMDIRVRYTPDGGTHYFTSEVKTVPLNTIYEIVDLGPIPTKNYADLLSGINSNPQVDIQMKRPSGSDTGYCELICYLPVDEYYTVSDAGNTRGSGYAHIFLEDRYGTPLYFTHSTGTDEVTDAYLPILGYPPKLKPDVEQRLLFITTNANGQYVHTTSQTKYTIYYRPRTEFFL